VSLAVVVVVVVVYDDDMDHNGYLYYWFHVRVQNDFVALLVNVDQMIEEEKKCYRYMMYEAKELVVLVHVDDFYITKIRKRHNVKTWNQYIYIYFFFVSKIMKNLRIGLIVMMTRCMILLLLW
jgi:hypothetical protein